MRETHSLQEFQEAAREYARGLTPLPDHATVVGLCGDLGSGKTTFVQDVAKALGISHHLASPTFLIMKSYSLRSQHFAFLVHIDTYRLKQSEELKKLGFEKLLANPRNLIFIEWVDRVADLLPPDAKKISFEYIDDKTRKISYMNSRAPRNL